MQYPSTQTDDGTGFAGALIKGPVIGVPGIDNGTVSDETRRALLEGLGSEIPVVRCDACAVWMAAAYRAHGESSHKESSSVPDKAALSAAGVPFQPEYREAFYEVSVSEQDARTLLMLNAPPHAVPSAWGLHIVAEDVVASYAGSSADEDSPEIVAAYDASRKALREMLGLPRPMYTSHSGAAGYFDLKVEARVRYVVRAELYAKFGSGMPVGPLGFIVLALNPAGSVLSLGKVMTQDSDTDRSTPAMLAFPVIPSSTEASARQQATLIVERMADPVLIAIATLALAREKRATTGQPAAPLHPVAAMLPLGARISAERVVGVPGTERQIRMADLVWPL